MTDDIFPSCGATPSYEFEVQYRRVFEAAQCKTQVELAEFLDIRQSSISDAKKRKAIPSDWLVKLFTKLRINPDWVRDGVSPQFLIPADDGHVWKQVIRVTEVRPPHECSAQELVNELVRRAMQPIEVKALEKEPIACQSVVDNVDGRA